MKQYELDERRKLVTAVLLTPVIMFVLCGLLGLAVIYPVIAAYCLAGFGMTAACFTIAYVCVLGLGED